MNSAASLQAGSGRLEAPAGRIWDRRSRLALFCLMAGLVILYVPVVVEFGPKLWWDEDGGHAGILLLCVLGVYWHERTFFEWGADRTAFLLGSLCVAIALLLYTLGLLTAVVHLEGFSLPAIAFGLTLATGGWPLLRRWWLLAILLAFTIPWLGPFADAILVPLRLYVTSAAVSLLRILGFQLSASGVIVTVGFVQLNVAGACVGLRSMIAIMALGLLSLHLFPPRSFVAGLAFLALLPIVSLGVNLLRVCLLIVTAAEFGAGGAEAVHDVAAYGEVILCIALFMGIARYVSTAEEP